MGSDRYDQLTIDDIQARLRRHGYSEFRRLSSQRLFVYVTGDREDAMEHIIRLLPGSTRNMSTTAISSIGSIAYKTFEIFVKPERKYPAGKNNEWLLVNAVLAAIHENGGKPIEVRFVGANQTVVVRNVIAVQSLYEDADRVKGDVRLFSRESETQISLKQDNAEAWESADSYWAENASKVIDKAIERGLVALDFHEESKCFTLSSSLATKATLDEKTDVVFGDDPAPVVVRTFSDRDFHSSDGVLEVKCTYIITNPHHVTGDYDVWFLIRNDSSRRASKLPPGIRVLAVFEKRISSKTIVCPRVWIS